MCREQTPPVQIEHSDLMVGGRPPPVSPSCRIAVPLDTARIVKLIEMPITSPCHEPVRFFSFSKAFCASDFALRLVGFDGGV
jgi:hypothetical protein